MKLYNFHRSSASYRVRIVASLKGLAYEYVPINLIRGESRTPAYEALNPQGKGTVSCGRTHSQAGLEPPLPIQISTWARAWPRDAVSQPAPACDFF